MQNATVIDNEKQPALYYILQSLVVRSYLKL